MFVDTNIYLGSLLYSLLKLIGCIDSLDVYIDWLKLIGCIDSLDVYIDWLKLIGYVQNGDQGSEDRRRLGGGKGNAEVLVYENGKKCRGRAAN